MLTVPSDFGEEENACEDCPHGVDGECGLADEGGLCPVEAEHIIDTWPGY